MPREKRPPRKRTLEVPGFESGEENETVIADDEVERLKEELELIRQQKSLQIKKMRLLEESRQNRDVLSSSDHDFDVKPARRSSTKSLAIGIDKAQQRYMFNVRRMEEKYSEKERRHAPETMIEMDHDGQFFYPENMAGSHQQQFINRLFQRDGQMGKGLVSAPRNSIDSFDGDVRALKKCQLLDERFGKEVRESRRTSEEVTLRTERSSMSSRFRSTFYEEMDDDVFSERGRDSLPEKRDPRRRPTTSTLASFFDDESTDEEDNDFADDEEVSEEDSTSSEESEESEREEESTPVAPKVKKEVREVTVAVANLKTEPRASTPENSDPKVETVKRQSPRLVSVKQEPQVITLSDENRPLRDQKITKFIKTEPPAEPKAQGETLEKDADTPRRSSRIQTTVANPTPKDTPLPSAFPEVVAPPVKATEADSEKPPQADLPEKSSPHDHCHGEKSEKPRKGRAKSPYCKHCELIKEEKKKAKLDRKSGVKPDDSATPKDTSERVTRSKKVTPKTKSPPEGPSCSGTKRRSAAVAAEEPTLKKQKLTDSDLFSIPSSTAVVVDTELIASENPQLASSSLLKFSENESPDSSVWSCSIDQNWVDDVKKAANNANETKIFGISVKKVSSETSIIANWANNLRPGNFEKDPFERDYRRQVAQSKKARIDGKAGYDVRL